MILRQGTAVAISFGPFVSPTDGVTLQTGLVSAIDHASTGIFLSKNGGALTIRHASVTASTYDAYGNYIVTLDTTDTGTVGRLRVQFAAAASCLPVWRDFDVISQTVFDALFASGAAGYGTAQTGDSFARLGAPAGASTAADIAAAKVDTAAIKLQTDKLAFTVANQIDANVLDWKSATAPAMTGDAYARLGAPAGASAAADTAAVKADTAAIKLKTDNLTAAPADETLVIAATNAIMSRLGAPAGASAAADIAAVKADTAAVKLKTDHLPSSDIVHTLGKLWVLDGDGNPVAPASGVPSAATIAAAVRDVDNGSPAAGSLGEAARNADAKAADLQITIGAPVVSVSADIAAVKAQTDLLPSDPADESLIIAATNSLAALIGTPAGASLAADIALKTGYRLSATGVNDILRTTMTEGYAALGAAPTLEQFMFMIEAQLRSRALVGTTPAVMTSHKLDGTSVAMTYDVDDAMDPTTQERAS